MLTVVSAALLSSCSSPKTEIYPIQDNAEPRRMPITLFPEAPDSLITASGLEEGIPSSVCAFLVRTEGQEILFDAANGDKDSRLMSVLDSLGTSPEDISHIFITHLHGDHIGGLMAGGKAAFPEAVLHINKVEIDAWTAMEPEGNPMLRTILDIYKDRLDIFTLNDELPLGINAVEAYGHTPGHTMYRIGNILIAGDIMHGVALQKDHPEYCARFDMDPQKAVEARRSLLKDAEEQGLTVYGMHFPAPYHL